MAELERETAAGVDAGRGGENFEFELTAAALLLLSTMGDGRALGLEVDEEAEEEE